MTTKYCFMNRERVCDLTCKAAFPVDDPVDPVDCYFIWLAANVGEGVFDVHRLLENLPGGAPPGPPAGESPPPSEN